MKRLAAMQDWPLFSRRANAATSAARGRSADGMTTNGSLPPSSSTTFLISLPAMAATDDPAGPGPGQRRGHHPAVAQDRLDPGGADEQGLEGSRGEPGPGEQVLHEQRRLRHVRGVLEQAHVARHQRGGGEPHRLPEREVPRHDGQDRAERLIADVGALRADGAGVGGLVGQEPFGVLGVIPAGGGALGHFLLRGGQRLAHLGGHHGRDLVLLRVQDRGCLAHPPGPFGETGQAVTSVHRRRGGQAALDVCLAHLVVGLDGLPGRGVNGRDRHGLLPSAARRHCRGASTRALPGSCGSTPSQEQAGPPSAVITESNGDDALTDDGRAFPAARDAEQSSHPVQK